MIPGHGLLHQRLSRQELVIGRDGFLAEGAVPEAPGEILARGAHIHAHEDAAMVVVPGEVGFPIHDRSGDARVCLHARPGGIPVLLQLVIDGLEVLPEDPDRIGGPAGPGILVEGRPDGRVHHLDGRGCGDVGVELLRGNTRVDELLAPEGDGFLNDLREGLSEIVRRVVRAEATIQSAR